MILLSGSTLAVALNLAYNVAVARFLGPKGFGNANAVFTILTLISAVTLSFQIVTSKVIAQLEGKDNRDAAFRDLQRAACLCGLAAAAVLIVFQHQITAYLDLPESKLLLILAVGVAFYVPLGARRGYIQGAFGFNRLATNLVLEGAARLIGSVAMVLLGFGVPGVIMANAAAVIVAFFAITPRLNPAQPNPLSFSKVFREVSHAAVFFGGQVLINNCDIVLVKHFFQSGEAGLYAAIAMVGRVTFSCSMAIVNGMFPVVAGAKREERKNVWLIGTALLLVLAVGVAIALVLRFSPAIVWTTLFGASFQLAGPHGFSYLLFLYAVTTLIYCLSVVVMTYEMSYKIANTTWYQLIFSAALIAAICKYHGSLQQVIMVQLVVLIVFLVVVAIPFLLDTLGEATEDEPRPLRLISRLTEDQVISEFLKSDFAHAAYSHHHQALHNIVFNPDTDNKAHCTIRRDLLAVRHLALWRELPADTEWFQVEISTDDLKRIQVFPRAQWTRVARGNFSILKVAESIKRRRRAQDPFVEKISDIREVLSEDVLSTGSVILIGLSDSDPLTVLDGNHRFVAAVLEGKVERLTYICGLSTNMLQCCWYKTNFFNLVRYGRNLLRHCMNAPGNRVPSFNTSSPHPEDSTSTLEQTCTNL
jgi:O-antigen/teichoic acid export membrane protein